MPGDPIKLFDWIPHYLANICLPIILFIVFPTSKQRFIRCPGSPPRLSHSLRLTAIVYIALAFIIVQTNRQYKQGMGSLSYMPPQLSMEIYLVPNCGQVRIFQLCLIGKSNMQPACLPLRYRGVGLATMALGQLPRFWVYGASPMCFYANRHSTGVVINITPAMQPTN